MTDEQTSQFPLEYGLALGSNVGNRLKHITSARNILDGMPTIELLDSAHVYETDPVGVAEEHKEELYLNTVVIVLTKFAPEEMFDIIHQIESDKGRIRTDERNAPRPLDIDIIYAGRLNFQCDNICIPHIRWASRKFVVQPLADVRSGLLIPGETRTVQEILDRLPENPKVMPYKENW
jgi:2-amino-4-hydroxy-6-hydroxymethyldihydropteridine diphosphokinase